MTLLKDSVRRDELKDRYDRLWVEFQHTEDTKVQSILNEAEYKLLSRQEKLFEMIRPFKTHLLWVIPLCVVSVILALYSLFIWVALWVE